MKEPINKKELIKEGVEDYISHNPNVISSLIIKYKYGNRKLYQPWLYNKQNKLIGNRVGYWDIEVAKKVIDNYEDKIKEW